LDKSAPPHRDRHLVIPGLVLIHGGAHAADSWDLVVDELTFRAPELRVLAVDLPGRRSNPAQLSTLRIADWVGSVVADVEKRGLGDVVVVGHSLAGVTVPGVVAKLGHPRVREAIFVATCVPPQGSSVIDSLNGPLALLTRVGVSIGWSFPMPTAAARFAFWNGMSRDERRFAAARLYPEPLSVAEAVDRGDMPEEVPRTWILTLRDRSMSPRRQRTYIDELGGVDAVICVDTCHDVMYSEPRRLAQILIERCRLRAQP
jgi:pimeloyl-ACP methyl ester carboxylesterase